MTAAGDAVLAVALGEVGYTEDPPGSNETKYWDWYGQSLGSWCACFVSWCCAMAGYPMCAIDSGNGFVLVSNGTLHSYAHFEQNIEAQRTMDLQPGDVVLFSWYSWDWSGTPGAGGVPIITDAEWAGWVAGDHTGIAATSPDGDGYFCTVEGNTSQSSWDNGGAVLYRTDRHISQVCGWWRPLAYGEGGAHPIEPPKPTYNLTEQGMFIMFGPSGAAVVGPGYVKGLTGDEYNALSVVPGMVVHHVDQYSWDLINDAALKGITAGEV